jgi:pimeloyl-ACP methyl ester carboxylesterase
MTATPPKMNHQAQVEEVLLNCTDGMRIAGQRWTHPQKNSSEAPNTNRRILCIHGFMDNCRSFYYLAPFLISNLPHDTELVAIDLPGHGISSHGSKDHPPLNVLSEMVYYVAEAVHALQWDDQSSFTLIGHSMGSAISVMYTATFPEQVEKFIILDGFGPDYADPNHTSRILRKHIDHRLAKNGTPKPPKVYRNLKAACKTRQKTATNSPGNHQWLSESAALEMVKRAVRYLDGGGALQFRHDPRLVWPPIQLHTIPQVISFFRDIQCPTYWLRAAHGWPFPPDMVQQAEALLMPEQVLVLPGSHHFHADPETAPVTAQAVLDAIRN